MDVVIRFGVVLQNLPDLFTEVMRMRLRSVVAIEFDGHDSRQHLALSAGQG